MLNLDNSRAMTKFGVLITSIRFWIFCTLQGAGTNDAPRVRRLMMPYDDQNIFAKMLRGEIPSFKIYENERAFAFLDIMPRSPGHTLVIPKAPARGILDIAEDDLAEVARARSESRSPRWRRSERTASSSSSSASPPAAKWCFTCTCMSCRSKRASNCCRPRPGAKTLPFSKITPGG